MRAFGSRDTVISRYSVLCLFVAASHSPGRALIPMHTSQTLCGGISGQSPPRWDRCGAISRGACNLLCSSSCLEVPVFQSYKFQIPGRTKKSVHAPSSQLTLRPDIPSTQDTTLVPSRRATGFIPAHPSCPSPSRQLETTKLQHVCCFARMNEYKQ